SQSAWSTGAGWGLILTYAVYMREKEDIVLNSFISGFGNNSASLLAGMAIFPAVFALAPALGQSPEAVLAESGPASTGLTFIWVPELFQELPAANLFMAIFFLALTMAALSSLIAMLELAVRVLLDLNWTRKRAVLFVWIVGFVFGAPSAINLSIFQNQDWVWGVGLILSGFFIAFTANRYGISRFRKQLINGEGADIKVGKWYEIVLRYLIPIQFISLISWWFYQAISSYDPSGWWHPFHIFSVGTCLLQWGAVIVIFLIFNNQLYSKMRKVQEAGA
ncbi:MAG: sodium-dependent transporter, partial [Calditrichaeota bacterium]